MAGEAWNSLVLPSTTSSSPSPSRFFSFGTCSNLYTNDTLPTLSTTRLSCFRALCCPPAPSVLGELHGLGFEPRQHRSLTSPFPFLSFPQRSIETSQTPPSPSKSSSFISLPLSTMTVEQTILADMSKVSSLPCLLLLRALFLTRFCSSLLLLLRPSQNSKLPSPSYDLSFGSEMSSFSGWGRTTRRR